MLLSTTSLIPFFTKHNAFYDVGVFCLVVFFFLRTLEMTQPFPQHWDFWIHSWTSIQQAVEVSKIQSSRTMKISSLRGNHCTYWRKAWELNIKFCFTKQYILSGFFKGFWSLLTPSHGLVGKGEVLGMSETLVPGLLSCEYNVNVGYTFARNEASLFHTVSFQVFTT